MVSRDILLRIWACGNRANSCFGSLRFDTLLHFLSRSQRQSVFTIDRHCYGHVFCSGLCQYPLNIRGDKHNLQFPWLFQYLFPFHRRRNLFVARVQWRFHSLFAGTMLIRVSNTFGLCFHLRPFSWIYQLRFRHVQSSTKSTASLVMHMPFFNTALSMSANHIQHGLKHCSAQH